MNKPELSEREQLILQAVVHTFITSAEAVGSRSIVKRYELDLSPATVRNVMADLEEAGYVQQLHASSGRVPTDRGYRYYVDYLMRVQELTLNERARIEREFAEKAGDLDHMMRQTSHLLALVSHQTGLVESPHDEDAQIRRIELLPVSPENVAVMVADTYGRVKTMMVTPSEQMGEDELSRLSKFLNETLAGTAVDRLAKEVEARLRSLLDEQRLLAQRALDVLNLLPPQRPGQLFLEGATQLFEQPEFRDVAKVRGVLSALEERERLLELLRESTQAGGRPHTAVLIGEEMNREDMRDISLVVSPYYVGEKAVGTLGVLGPRRMPYSKLTAVVDYTAGMLSRFLTRLAE